MEYRTLGKTGIQISAISFGAGPISTLMVGDDADRQRKVIEYAIRAGVNWFDTAASYGNGRSELSLGSALAQIGVQLSESRNGSAGDRSQPLRAWSAASGAIDGLATTPPAEARQSVPSHYDALLKAKASTSIHVATKVRLMPDELRDIRSAVLRSFEGSLQRLQLPRVTLLQLHNSITSRRGDEPTSVTPSDVLGPRGIAEVFRTLRDEGLVGHLGITGIGAPSALREVIGSGEFETMQVPYHLLNPSAGREMASEFAETNYGNIIADCARVGMGVLAIRVLAGGALVDNPPSPHTLKTPYFPLALYERDRRRAARLQNILGSQRSLRVEAVRFALAHPQIGSALIGFAQPHQIDEAVAALDTGKMPLDWEDVAALAAPTIESR